MTQNAAMRIRPKRQIPPAPAHLAPAGAALWRSVLEDFDLEEAHTLALLAAACECQDKIAEARGELIAHGSLTFETQNGQPKLHPAATYALQAKGMMAKVFRQLCLDVTPGDDDAPPRLAHLK